MIHFRLRRSLRLAVDLLSLNFAPPLNGPRSRYLTLLGTGANASAVLHHGIPSAWHTPQASPSLSPPLHSLDSSSGLRGHRYFASIALLLALSLEVCGCHPAGNSSLAMDPETDTNAADHSSQELAAIEPAMSFYDPPESTMAPAARTLRNLSVDPPPIPI